MGRYFVLMMALLVAINYLLVITLFPAIVALWSTYVRPCEQRAARFVFRSAVWRLGCQPIFGDGSDTRAHGGHGGNRGTLSDSHARADADAHLGMLRTNPLAALCSNLGSSRASDEWSQFEGPAVEMTTKEAQGHAAAGPSSSSSSVSASTQPPSPLAAGAAVGVASAHGVETAIPSQWPSWQRFSPKGDGRRGGAQKDGGPRKGGRAEGEAVANAIAVAESTEAGSDASGGADDDDDDDDDDNGVCTAELAPTPRSDSGGRAADGWSGGRSKGLSSHVMDWSPARAVTAIVVCCAVVVFFASSVSQLEPAKGYVGRFGSASQSMRFSHCARPLFGVAACWGSFPPKWRTRDRRPSCSSLLCPARGVGALAQRV